MRQTLRCMRPIRPTTSTSTAATSAAIRTATSGSDCSAIMRSAITDRPSGQCAELRAATPGALFGHRSSVLPPERRLCAFAYGRGHMEGADDKLLQFVAAQRIKLDIQPLNI